MEEKNEVHILDKLSWQLEEAKRHESMARQARLEVEAKILETVGVKEEGSATIKSDFYKVTTTGGITRSLDAKKFEDIKGRLPLHVAEKVVRLKPELDVRQFKALKDLSPDLYAIMAEAVTSKPRKASVKIERLEASA
ncbi:hypothetical protein GZ77_09020 [Endozoicomonas montiporae]|uniref:Uncharacterized protein n=2 Tax=Endozoicomonas montiporae TaxID=1027273 RepID=A0A081N7R6_9GAMM|nr:hypothetical protein [Endozoicomonas montiporae]AMO55653.1 hypothetical protein EZMO1_1485 [Endozoicomonas montiporae CL-33]KEQ14489.1 hypothetical protein GZ77_09020 [Endozoicomonas montiporae]